MYMDMNGIDLFVVKLDSDVQNITGNCFLKQPH